MIRGQHLDIAIAQSRHRVLCHLMSHVPEGQYLVERARLLDIPVDWQDPRPYPSWPGHSDLGCIKKLAEDVTRIEYVRRSRMYGEAPDYLAIDALSRKEAMTEATTIFNRLHQYGIELSGYANGRYFTCAEPTPWTRPRRKPRAPALELVPPHSVRH